MDAPPIRPAAEGRHARRPGRAVCLALAALATAALVAVGCGGGGTLNLGGPDGGGTGDAGTFDAGGSGGGDGGGTFDAGTFDAGGLVDAGTPDAGTSDAGGFVDAGTPDAGGGGSGDGGVIDGGFGAPNHGYPSWSERAFLVLANAARMAPTAWRDHFMTDVTAAHGAILDPSVYPAQPPLHFYYDLARAARFHSADLASTANCAFGHSSCDGTTFSARVRTYDPGAVAIGENIAAGDPDPRRTLDFLLCDAPSSGAPCCADGTSCDGHRKNLMTPGFTVTGTGFAQGTNQYTYYWTEDFADNTPADIGPIIAASHALLAPTQQFAAPDVGFFLNYDDPAGAPQSVTLYLAGTADTMTAQLGPPNLGTFVYTVPNPGSAAACQLYHFEVVDAAGRTWRYPETGSFATAGVGACATDQDWVP